MEALLDWGYIGLFVGSFVAATVVPFSSDVLLVGMLAAGGNVWLSVLVATVGNWAGGLTSYWDRLGSADGNGSRNTWRVKHETLERHKSKVDRFGAWLALLTWLPFFGDVFAVALGFYRVNFRKSGRLDAGRERRPLRMLGLIVHLGKRSLGIRPARHLPHGMEATATKNRETRQHDGQSRPSYSDISGKAGESGAKPGGIAYPERPMSENEERPHAESRESGFRTATETVFSGSDKKLSQTVF